MQTEFIIPHDVVGRLSAAPKSCWCVRPVPVIQQTSSKEPIEFFERSLQLREVEVYYLGHRQPGSHTEWVKKVTLFGIE